MDAVARIDGLQAEIDRLEDRVAQLESVLGVDFQAPLEWGLNPTMTKMLGVLMAREVATKDAMMAALYRDVGREEAQVKIVDVFICKLRAKLRPLGIPIETRWGVGYYLTPAAKAAIAAARVAPAHALSGEVARG